MEVRLDGRTALITGGSLGLGRAMASKFAESGANVAIVARRQEHLDDAKAEIEGLASTKIGAYSCDVMEADQINATFAAAEADLGPVDILVNNAGTSKRAPFLDISVDDWRHDLELKFFSAVRLSQLAILGMKERG
jgi:NAD(P)-dependent dehydrogenase (short-subunit alcohol dehydrogenase family)